MARPKADGDCQGRPLSNSCQRTAPLALERVGL